MNSVAINPNIKITWPPLAATRSLASWPVWSKVPWGRCHVGFSRSNWPKSPAPWHGRAATSGSSQGEGGPTEPKELLLAVPLGKGAMFCDFAMLRFMGSMFRLVCVVGIWALDIQLSTLPSVSPVYSLKPTLDQPSTKTMSGLAWGNFSGFRWPLHLIWA